MFRIFKVTNNGTCVPQEVDLIDFSKPVIMQLPDAITYCNSPKLMSDEKFGKENANLFRTLASSKLSIWPYNIYTIRCDGSMGVGFMNGMCGADADLIEEEPTTYYNVMVEDFVNRKLLGGLLPSSTEKHTLLPELKARISQISFFGFSYGAILAEMIANGLVDKLKNNGINDDEIKDVASCLYFTLTGSVYNYPLENSWTNSVRSVHWYDHVRIKRQGADDTPPAGQKIRHERKGSSLLLTTYEPLGEVHSAKLEIEGDRVSWVARSSTSSHFPHFSYNTSTFHPEEMLQTFQTNHAAHIVAASIRKGAESSLESKRTAKPRNGKELVSQIERQYLNPAALRAAEASMRMQNQRHHDLSNSGRE